jgi:tRNA(adenine34) deaminase
VTQPEAAWASLSQPWQIAFEEAWESFRSGSAGVGAAVTNADDLVVATGRNRVLDEPDGTAPLAGTRMAHAEMNALATIRDSAREGYTLYTTYEPCVMCAATIRIYRIPKVVYAADDPVWEGMHDLFRQLAPIARGLPDRELLRGPWGAFAHLLHLTWLVDHAPDHVLDAHRTKRPQYLDVAMTVANSGELSRLVSSGAGVIDAAGAFWGDIEALVT